MCRSGRGWCQSDLRGDEVLPSYKVKGISCRHGSHLGSSDRLVLEHRVQESKRASTGPTRALARGSAVSLEVSPGGPNATANVGEKSGHDALRESGQSLVLHADTCRRVSVSGAELRERKGK